MLLIMTAFVSLHSDVKVILHAISLVSLLKGPYSGFSSYFSFLNLIITVYQSVLILFLFVLLSISFCSFFYIL